MLVKVFPLRVVKGMDYFAKQNVNKLLISRFNIFLETMSSAYPLKTENNVFFDKKVELET